MHLGLLQPLPPLARAVPSSSPSPRFLSGPPSHSLTPRLCQALRHGGSGPAQWVPWTLGFCSRLLLHDESPFYQEWGMRACGA